MCGAPRRHILARRSKHSISVLHTLLDPLPSSDTDTFQQHPPPLSLTTMQFLEVVCSHSAIQRKCQDCWMFNKALESGLCTHGFPPYECRWCTSGHWCVKHNQVTGSSTRVLSVGGPRWACFPSTTGTVKRTDTEFGEHPVDVKHSLGLLELTPLVLFAPKSILLGVTSASKQHHRCKRISKQRVDQCACHRYCTPCIVQSMCVS